MEEMYVSDDEERQGAQSERKVRDMEVKVKNRSE